MMRHSLLSLKNWEKFGKLSDFNLNNQYRELLPEKTIFLPLLENLAKVDETVVREQAAKSLCTIAKALSDAEI